PLRQGRQRQRSALGQQFERLMTRSFAVEGDLIGNTRIDDLPAQLPFELSAANNAQSRTRWPHCGEDVDENHRILYGVESTQKADVEGFGSFLFQGWQFDPIVDHLGGFGLLQKSFLSSYLSVRPRDKNRRLGPAHAELLGPAC